MAFTPHRIVIDGIPVSPPEYTYTQLQASGYGDTVTALQRWLGTIPVTGVWDTNTATALEAFRNEKNLSTSPQTVTVAVWDALEAQWAASDVRSRKKTVLCPGAGNPRSAECPAGKPGNTRN